MTLQTTLDDVKAMLASTDADLRHLSLEQVEDLCHAEEGLSDERLWPTTLKRLFLDSDPVEKRALHWIVETHYGALMRYARGAEFWRLSALAYTRIIPLRLGYNESMGHRTTDTFFVLRSLKSVYPDVPRQSVRILDVGCGTGELLADLTSLGFTEVEGIDVSRAAISRAASRLQGSTATVTCMSLRRLLERGPTPQYQVVTLCDVLEHLPRSDVPEILRGLSRLLRPGGLLLLTTPSAITGPHDLDFVPRGCASAGLHLHEYRLHELRSTLYEAGYVTLRSPLLPPSGRWFATPSRTALRIKLALEPLLHRVPFPVAARVTEGLYFRGVVCRRR